MYLYRSAPRVLTDTKDAALDKTPKWFQRLPTSCRQPGLVWQPHSRVRLPVKSRLPATLGCRASTRCRNAAGNIDLSVNVARK